MVLKIIGFMLILIVKFADCDIMIAVANHNNHNLSEDR